MKRKIANTIPGLLLAASIAPLIWSRDFAAFLLLATFLAPMFLIITLAAAISAVAIKSQTYRVAVGSNILTAILVLTAVIFTTRYEHDRFEFLFWYPSHREFVQSHSNKDGIILNWDSWGMAGMSNDSFLVSVPKDNIASATDASQWSHSHGFVCDVIDTQRMRHGIYMFMTYNCPL